MKSRLSRKWLGAPIAVWLLILMMGTALALLISSKQTANEAFQARAIGAVNIGNMETEGFFASTVNLTNLEPTSQRSQCFAVTLNNPQVGDALKMYAGAQGGALSSTLTITVERNINAPFDNTKPAGLLASCGGTEWQNLFTGTLAQFKANHGSYATGLPMIAGREHRVTVAIPAGANGDVIAGQTANLSLFFENQG